MAVGGGSSDVTMRTGGLRECTAARGSAMAGENSWSASIDASDLVVSRISSDTLSRAKMVAALLLGTSASAASFACGSAPDAPATHARAAVTMIAEPAGPSSRQLRIPPLTAKAGMQASRTASGGMQASRNAGITMQAVMKDVALACKYHKSVGYDGYLQVTIDGTAVAPVVRLDPESEQVVGYDDDAEETTCSTADVARAFDECVGERAPAVDRRITLAPVSEQYRLRNRRQLCR